MRMRTPFDRDAIWSRGAREYCSRAHIPTDEGCCPSTTHVGATTTARLMSNIYRAVELLLRTECRLQPQSSSPGHSNYRLRILIVNKNRSHLNWGTTKNLNGQCPPTTSPYRRDWYTAGSPPRLPSPPNPPLAVVTDHSTGTTFLTRPLHFTVGIQLRLLFFVGAERARFTYGFLHINLFFGAAQVPMAHIKINC
jgi:hypothetical protein